ncbi:hypothetical protein [Streptacidiphilus cavernicola]|uniref:Uncharacterized protein n=1 Tax=Streptacidiphilus cavernicola TaxID=3342716 RepID=A0ABV6VZD5_9ACTN
MVPTSGLTAGMVLPLEGYEETYPQSVQLEQANGKLMGSCLQQFGFAPLPSNAGKYPPPSNDLSNMPRRYGLADPQAAAQYGYHLPADHSMPPGAAGPPLSAAEQLVAFGPAHGGAASAAPGSYRGKQIPQGGCLGVATRAVGSTVALSLVSRLDTASLDASQSDPRVVAVVRQWSGCMAGHGYRVADPFKAADLAPSLNSPKADAKEIAIATADVACKQQTGLVKTWFEVESAVQRQQIEQNRLGLSQARTQLEQAVKKAADVVG